MRRYASALGLLVFALAGGGACQGEKQTTSNAPAAGSAGVGTSGAAGTSTGGRAGGAQSGAAGQGAAGGSGAGAGSGGGGGGGTVVLADCPDVGLDAATVHYVCDCQAGAASACAAGDDSATGDIGAPWQTVQKAQQTFSSMSAGGTIAFCRGGSFDNGGSWVNENKQTGCSAAEPCVVRDYTPPGASGNPPRPIFTVSSGHGFDLENGGQAEHEEGYVFLNLNVRSTSLGTSGDGFFIYNDVDDVLVCGVSIDGFGVGFYMAGSNPAAAGSDAKNSRIELRGSSVTNNGSQGMLGACDDCVLAYDYFENNGFTATTPDQGSRNHNIYFSAHTLVTGMKAVGNELYQSAMVAGQCTGTPLVVHGRYRDLLIEGNSIHEDVDAAGAGCWGLAVDTGYANEREEFTDVVIRGNTVVNTGNVAIGTTGCTNCLIENNLVIQEQTAFGSRLVAVPNRDRGSEDQATTGVTVRNNTLIDLTSAAITGVALGTEGTAHGSTSNAIYGDAGGTLTCFGYDQPDASYRTRDDNLCFAASGTLRWEASQASLTAFQAATSADGRSLVLDPLFVSIQKPYDLRPQSGSPLVDHGNASAPTDDHDKNARDASPDIGAFER